MTKGMILLSLGWVILVASAEEVRGTEKVKIPSGRQSNSKVFYGNNLEAWEAPVEYQKTFGYYLSGFDEDCRPSDMGQWDVRKYVSQGEESRKIFRKYIHQAVERMVKSLDFNNTDCDVKPTDFIGILDADNFQYYQLASTKALQFVLDTLKDYLDTMHEYVQKAYFVNTNVVAQGFLLAARPIFGDFMERVEVYGTRKSSWIPKLLKKLPSDQLPTKFGGSGNFRPVKTYG